MLTTEQIAQAKRETIYRFPNSIRHEHDDCIRMAYEWLDAQIKTKTVSPNLYEIKHKIERWCGRYISMNDVEVAATLHPLIKGKYPYFNIRSGLVRPSLLRLDGIEQAHAHRGTYSESPVHDKYKWQESDDPNIGLIRITTAYRPSLIP